MKKLFSLFAAVLFAGSMMASNEDLLLKTEAGFNAITITTAGKSSTGADYEFSKGSVTVTGTKGYINNKKHIVYAGGTMVVSVGTNVVDSIQIEYNSSCYPFAELLAGGSTDTKTAAITRATFIPSSSVNQCTFTNVSKGKTEVRDINVFYHAATTGWDGTVVTSLDDKTVHSVADFEEMTIKLNGATIELSDEMGGLFLGNEDGSELYAVWNPAYNEYSESLLPGINCTYVMDGDEVTLSGWYSTPVEGALELVPIPETATEIYLIDYSTFIVDGEYIYISDEDEEWGAKVFAYEAPTPTTYTVTYTVTGLVEGTCSVQAGYYNESMTVGDEFVVGENTVPENVYAYVYTVVLEDYSVVVKVNGEAVTLTNGQWLSDAVITDDMTIEVVFRTTPTAVENIEAVKATKVVKDGQVLIIRDGKTYNVMGMQF